MEKMIFKLFAGSDGTGSDEDPAKKTEDDPKNDVKPEGHKPTDEEAKLIKEVMAKKEKIEQQSKQIAELSDFKKKIDDIGGFEALAKMVTDKKAAEQEALEKKGEWEKLKAQMAEAHNKEIGEFKTKIAGLEGQLKAETAKISQLTLGASFANSKYLEKTVLTSGKAQAIYGSYFDIGEDGKVTGYDKPRGAAGRTMLVDGQGNPVGFEAAIERIIAADPDKDSLLRAKGKQGGGSGTSGAVVDHKDDENTEKSGIDMILAGLMANK